MQEKAAIPYIVHEQEWGQLIEFMAVPGATVRSDLSQDTAKKGSKMNDIMESLDALCVENETLPPPGQFESVSHIHV